MVKELENDIRECNRLIKELDDIYHGIAISWACQTAHLLFFTLLANWGTAVSRRTSAMNPSPASRLSTPPSVSWRRMAIFI